MTHLISAELLRLRALRSSPCLALGALVLLAVLTAMPAIAGSGDPPPGPAEVAEVLRGTALTGVLLAAAFAASTVGTDAARGGTAMTYLAHPSRAGVTAARALTYAGLGLAFCAVAAGIVAAVGLHLTAAQGAGAGPSPGTVARLVLGACAGGAVLGAAGALVGIAARNATVAGGAPPAGTSARACSGLPAWARTCRSGSCPRSWDAPTTCPRSRPRRSCSPT
jgi:hypothetical protein